MSSGNHRGAESVRISCDESRLAELRGHEERLEALRARRTDLEVERIAAGVALRAARTEAAPKVSGAQADAIVDALDRLRRLESRHSAQLAYAGAGVRSQEALIERLRAGDDALGAWIEAGRADEGAAGRRIAKQALLVVCLAILALAFAVHLAFLVLLVPVGGAMSFLLWTGQDRSWGRMGARRRFERLRLEAPSSWTEAAVHERRRALSLIAEQVRERASTPPGDGADAEQEDVRERASTPPGDGVDAEQEDVRADLDAARSDLHDALAVAGLDKDRLDESAEAALRAVARVHRAGQALHGVVQEMEGERDGAGKVRESLYRSLAREGKAAPDGDASTGALEEGMEKLRRR